MPLESCRECKREVSSHAEKCPHCGCQYPTKTAANKQLLAILIGLIVFGLLMTKFFGANWLHSLF